MFYTNLIDPWPFLKKNCYQGPKNGRLIITLGLSEIPLAYTGLLDRKNDLWSL